VKKDKSRVELEVERQDLGAKTGSIYARAENERRTNMRRRHLLRSGVVGEVRREGEVPAGETLIEKTE
jgi:hypothetical protein